MRGDVVASGVVVQNLIVSRRISRRSRRIGSGPVSVLERRETRRFADEDGSSGKDEEIGDDFGRSRRCLSREISDFSCGRRSRSGGRRRLVGVLLVAEVGVGVLSSDVLGERSLATETTKRKKLCHFPDRKLHMTTTSKLTSCRSLERYTCTVASQCGLVDVEPRKRNR